MGQKFCDCLSNTLSDFMGSKFVSLTSSSALLHAFQICKINFHPSAPNLCISSAWNRPPFYVPHNALWLYEFFPFHPSFLQFHYVNSIFFFFGFILYILTVRAFFSEI